MRKTILICSLALLLSGCAPAALAPSPTPVNTVLGNDVKLSDIQTNVGEQKTMTAKAITIHTVKGDIEIQLYPQDAPKTVENFVTLASQGYYNNLTFHRVEPGFVIQGGDPNGNGTGGKSIFGDTFADELDPNTASYKEGYKEGVVAMANRGPNTNGSQFFIMLADNETLPHAYTIFGKVTKGIDVVKQIAVGDKMTSFTITQ
ncbi:MAG TPA: peptidylprolyl isomerase [Patescibacteria group bacterium]|nr:peptidylprolyl isomerase [Patescibacteria group bacterium]